MRALQRFSPLLLVVALQIVLLPAAEEATAIRYDQPATADYQALTAMVEHYNPDLDPIAQANDPERSILINNSFIGNASEQAEKATGLAGFAFLIFLPFLVLPMILLVVAVYKFRDRGDGRKPATFIHNDKLEIAWTLIPVVALVIVAIPTTAELFRIDNPPQDDDLDERLRIDVTGKQFSWQFDYEDHGIKLAMDPRVGQEAMVFVKDRVAMLTFGSDDVNHAWSVPAFGVRKDCFPKPRRNDAWFIPNRLGTFEGQCYELCGEGHGRMLFSAVVVDDSDFEAWVACYRHKFAALEVVDALAKQINGEEVDLAQAVQDYLGDAIGRRERIAALRYWTAFHFHVDAEQERARGRDGDDFDRRGANALRHLDKLIAAQPAPASEAQS